MPAGILSFTLICGFMAVAGYANTFVAQWAGNFQNAGKGTTPLVVKVGS